MPSRQAPVPRAATERTRARIVSAAERLFAERGFAGVTMPAIAAASGITAGAIYKHFASKADLFFEIVRRGVQATAASEAGGAERSLPDIVGGYTTRRQKLLRQLAVEVHYAAAKDPKVRRLLRQSLDLRVQDLERGFEAAQGAGGLDPALDAELLAWSVMVFILGLMHMETLAPQLVGDERWHDFVGGRVLALLGLPSPS
ncbi:MAG: TetR/AcrR family transcriptional regulator [Caulobacterales bacterium]